MTSRRTSSAARIVPEPSDEPSTPAGSRCAATSTRSSTTGTRSGCAAPARAASSSRTCSSPSTTPSLPPIPTRPVVEFPGRNVHANPHLPAGPLVPLLISEPAAVAVGIAQAAIDEYIEVLTTRHQYGPVSPLRADLTVFQRLLGQATALVDTAEAALRQVAADSWTEQPEQSRRTGVPRERRERASPDPHRAADHRAVQPGRRARVPHRRLERGEQGPADRALLPRPQHGAHPRDAAVRAHVGERRAAAAGMPPQSFF